MIGPPRFTAFDVDRVNDTWAANCGSTDSPLTTFTNL